MFRVCVRYVSLDPYHNHNTGTVPVWSINMYFGVGSVCALIIPKKNKALLYAIRSPQTQKYTYLLFWLLSWSEILLNKNYSKYSNLPTYYFTSCKAKLVYVYCIHKNLSTKINSGAWEIYYLPFSETENRESGPKSWIRVDGELTCHRNRKIHNETFEWFPYPLLRSRYREHIPGS